MLGVVPNKPLDASPLPVGEGKTFDWDARLSLEFIRDHSKTADIPSVMDTQLRLYRAAALESCEQYTGLLLSGQKTVEEPIESKTKVKWGASFYTHHLQYPTADGYVYIYGGTHVNDNMVFHVKPGSRKIKVPIRKDFIDLSNCCNPCSSWAANGGMLATYKAGYASVDAVPATAVLGMLQFITWCIEHPGDELLTQRNRIETRAGLAGLQGSNNIAMISGALETWRTMDSEAW